MKKTIKKLRNIFIIFIISLFIIQISAYAANDDTEGSGSTEESFGRQCTGLSVEFCTIKVDAVSGSKDNVVNKLSYFYGYPEDGGVYTNLMVGTKTSTSGDECVIQAKILSTSGSTYTVKFGDEDRTVTNFEVGKREFTYSELCNELACPYDESEIVANSTEWEIVLILSTDQNPPCTHKYFWEAYTYQLVYYINEAYSGDYLNGDNVGYDRELGDPVEVNFNTVVTVVLDFATGVADTILDIADGVADVFHWVSKFTSNAFGTLTNIILDVIMGIFGDAPQLMINYIQTFVDGTAADNTFLYTFKELQKDQNQNSARDTYSYAVGERDKYTNIKDGEDGTIDVDILDVDKDSYMFEDVEVPITSVDIYTMATNQVSLLDVNFFVTDGAGADSSIWKSLRNIIARLILSTIYVAALILITALIWYGVKIAMNSMNPLKKAQDKDGLNRFITGVTMLVGSIIIMAVSIYAYQAIDITESISSDSESKSNDYEFPIRVHLLIKSKDWYDNWTIGDQEYSFSTTITGYLRLMAEIENPDRCMEKAGYVIAYIILANMNLIIFIIMIVRMLAMWILAPVGPILSALYAFTSDQKMADRYRTWAYCYVILGFIQLFFAIACWIMMETMGFN